MQKDFWRMGFGKRTGIDLPFEQAGLIPTNNIVTRTPLILSRLSRIERPAAFRSPSSSPLRERRGRGRLHPRGRGGR